MRPEVGGMVIGVREKSSATFDARVLPGDINTFSPTQGEEHWDIIGAAMEAISVFFPSIPQAKFYDCVSGLSTYTPHGQIRLGPIPGVRTLFPHAGCFGRRMALSA